MLDVTHTITAKSDQLNAIDLVAGPVTVKVLNVDVKRNTEQPIIIDIDQGFKPFKPCLTVRRILATLWGKDSSKWLGRSMTLYCDESVTWGGERVGGIRISAMSHIEKEKEEVLVRISRTKVARYFIDKISSILKSASDIVEDIRAAQNTNQMKSAIDGIDALSDDDVHAIREEYAAKQRFIQLMRDIEKANADVLEEIAREAEGIENEFYRNQVIRLINARMASCE